MLRTCTKGEIDSYVEFAYELALNIEKSAYPTYCDGVKTKEMFVERLKRAFSREDEEILLFEYEGKVEGLIQYYWIPEDHYIQTCVFNINKATNKAIAEFLKYVEERFKDYDLFMGFPAENKEAVGFLEKNGFECIENDINNTAFIDKIKDFSGNKLVRITKENYNAFKILHDQLEEDMYWNSDRILADLEEWTILLKEENGISQGAIYFLNGSDDSFEIFGVDMINNEFNPDTFKTLLHGALFDVKEKGGKTITFFCEEEAEQATLECGFVYVGRYLCYNIHIK